MKSSTARIRSGPILASIVGTGASVSQLGDDPWRAAGPTFPSAQALLRAAPYSDAILISAVDADQAMAWLTELRGSSLHALTPIFCTHSCDETVASLLDGAALETAHIYERIEAINERRALMAARSDMDEEDRFLAFLYTRSERHIRPICNWRAQHVYEYPLLNAFAPPGMSGDEWLGSLRRRSLIEPVELIDRVRQCPACSGAHLNFVDTCALCSSIDIAENIFLHCHACGHVAKQADFVSNHTLGCPKCQVRLRHIGVDYDRALEAFSCGACDGRFTEPEVKAHCLHCRKAHATDSLLEKRVDSYRLSETGQLSVRTGRVGELFALIDETNCVHPAYFEQTLDFLLNLSRRHSEVQFGLVCLRFANVRELLVKLPRVQVSQLIDGFALRLRELVRTTDMVMRSDDEHCWMLLPQTPPEGLKILLGRVEKIPEALQSVNEARLSLSIASTASRDLKDGKAEAVLLMAELKSQVA